MKSFFVSSDVHSAYTPWMAALAKAGFDENNPDHIIVLCGDAFDRMSESEEVFMFIMRMIEKGKIILIKGNHDTLLEECCKRGFAYSHDWSNGTVRTINDIGGAGEGKSFDQCCETAWNRMARYRELLVNYYETKNYIFVHSWIPTTPKEIQHEADKWIPLTIDEYMEDWRTATDVEWEEAMWVNPFKMWEKGLNITGKTIVFGHWHCSTGHRMLGHCEDEFKYAIWEPCYADGIIGIDRCTAHTGEVNVIVLEDEFIENC